MLHKSTTMSETARFLGFTTVFLRLWEQCTVSVNAAKGQMMISGSARNLPEEKCTILLAFQQFPTNKEKQRENFLNSKKLHWNDDMINPENFGSRFFLSRRLSNTTATSHFYLKSTSLIDRAKYWWCETQRTPTSGLRPSRDLYRDLWRCKCQ